MGSLQVGCRRRHHPGSGGDGVYVSRVQDYMHKALKEAKVHTSWINANDEYERAVRDFVAAVLERDESADGVVENEDEGEGESESEDKGGGGGAGDAFLPDFEEF